MPPDIKKIILTNMNVKLYSCTLTLRGGGRKKPGLRNLIQVSE